jgi:hypothetical protein
MVTGTLTSVRITLEGTRSSVLGYVYLREIASGQVHKTKKIAPGVFADYDSEDHLLGIEFLAAERADGALMDQLATQLDAPELSGIDLAKMCKGRG